MLRFFAAAAAVASVAQVAQAAVIPIMDWSLDYGYCKAKSPYLRREQLEPVAAEKGDVLDIRYATVSDMSGHDVLRYPDEKSWLACDESQATVVESDPAAGGGCEHSSDFRCLASNPGVMVPVDGPLFLACSGMHCHGGVKLRVHIQEREKTAPAGRDVIVPSWTDDWGFCEDIEGVDGGVHRPHGMTTIFAYEGDALIFKYSSKHNVWRAPDAASYWACDFDRMTEVGDVDAGGGCDHSDDSLGPWGSAEGRGVVFFEKLPNYDGALDVEAVELGGSTLPGLTVSEGPSGLRIDGSLIGSPWSGGDDDATGQGEIHLHAGTSCDAAGGHYYPSYATDPWSNGGEGLVGGVGSAAWTMGSESQAPIAVRAGGIALADALLRTVIIHDADGVRAFCGVVRYEKPGTAWAHSKCLPRSKGFSYPLRLDDSDAVAVRDQPATSWVGEGNAGASEDFDARSATTGAVSLHFVCQVHDHCVNGQKVVAVVLPRPLGGASRSDEHFDDDVEVGVLVFLVLLVVALLAAVACLYLRGGRRKSTRSEETLELTYPSLGKSIDASTVAAPAETKGGSEMI